ncbi:unnamed protein product [Brassica rapa]|uniref:Uncharacterized protein n=2 Tax=Brassica TaxID=3705 RepID=A0A8D9GXD8_BRACM|nr:unnamed protein product [Brassica napus]CAG7888718.1 unnamed protein product [Brassica rapa]
MEAANAEMVAANAEMVAVNAEMEAAISKMEAAKAEMEAAISKMEAAKVEMEAANASMEGNTLLMRTFINMLKIIICDCVVPSVLLENMTLCRVNNFPRPTDPMDPLKSDNQISDDYIIDDIQKMIDAKTPPVNVMIPTSDGDFEEIVSKLKKHGHTFLLAYNDDRNAEGDLPSQVLVSLADQSWGWRTFLGLVGIKVMREEIGLGEKSCETSRIMEITKLKMKEKRLRNYESESEFLKKERWRENKSLFFEHQRE